jgi:diguanylate cyclase (GGDEF)-like protein
MSTIVTLLAGIAGGMVLAVMGIPHLRKRLRSGRDLATLPADMRHVLDLIRRAHGAHAACVMEQDDDPVWSKSTPAPPPRLIERTVMLASLALAERREHVVKEDGVIVAYGDGRLGGAVLFAYSVDGEAVRAASADLRRMLAEFVVSRTSGERTAPQRRSSPEWLTPDTIEGVGAALCEAARRRTSHPAAVVTRDPLTQQASVTAVSAGADRRLMRTSIAPGSVVGRACIGDITSTGEGGELFGTHRYNRRRREERGEVFSLSDGSQGVGALVVFNGAETLDSRVKEQVEGLVDAAGPILGRTVDLYAARHRAMTDELTGQPNRHALEHAMREHPSAPCSLLGVYVDQLDGLPAPAASAALKHVARIFRRSLRDYDVPARVGDEDFALFLPDTPFHHAFEVAERVRVAVSEEVFDWAGGEHLLTCSFGVASVPEASETTEGLLEAASVALHEARREGANRISAAHTQLN